MRGLGLTIACVVLSAAATAQAQTITAVGDSHATITYDTAPSATTSYHRDSDGNLIEGAVHNAAGKKWASGNRMVPERKGGSFEAIVDTDGPHISFESGTAASGPYSSSTSYSGVDITVANYGGDPLAIANFGSTIIPAGLGFYLLDRSTPFDPQADGRGNTFTGYGQTNSGLTFGDLATDGDLAIGSTVGFGASNPFAFADFDFTITSLETTLYHLTGSLSMYLDENYNVRQGWNLSDASLALDGFTGVHGTPASHDALLNNKFAYGFAWDATDIVVPLNAYLTEGQSQVISYNTRVTTYTRTGCLNLNVCLVGYSGFGDPIGRGGGVDSVEEAFSAFSDFETFDAPPPQPITGIVFDPVQFDAFRLIGGAVPEPSTWMTMIMGFGMLGATLRRRRAAFSRI